MQSTQDATVVTDASHTPLAARTHDMSRPISVAILAMGGQGGGVLADWIVALAEREGFVAQSTSVPGVAQRTGATIYYVEMMPRRGGRDPLLSLMPAPGEVDLVLACEYMEAGRSILRGFVTPDRTTLIASTHRSFAVVEKERPGNGIAASSVVTEASGFAAKRVIAFDMQTLAEKARSVISASMFGALASSGALPFSREAFEAVIREGGKGADASLNAFSLAYDAAMGEPKAAAEKASTKPPFKLPGRARDPELSALLERIGKSYPADLHEIVFAGVRKVLDFQDVAYANEYLSRLDEFAAFEWTVSDPARRFKLTGTLAKYLANAMAYDDPYRVAHLKVRGSRFSRVRSEIGAKPADIVQITEFMHPRIEEVCGSLPRGLGEFIERRKGLSQWLDRRINKGRRMETSSLGHFLVLYVVARLGRLRRTTLRHAREVAHLEHWLGEIRALAHENYDLAVEVAAARRLVKGYSDTHARGHSKFDRVMSAVPKLTSRSDGAAWIKRLVAIALKDEGAVDLDGALRTIETL